jgi:hypothetical protein
MSFTNVKALDDRNVLQLDDRRYARLGWLLMLGGFLGFLGWAALAPLDKGVAVSGNVMVSGHRKVVQHPSGGIVARIDVRDGDKRGGRAGADSPEGDAAAGAGAVVAQPVLRRRWPAKRGSMPSATVAPHT